MEQLSDVELATKGLVRLEEINAIYCLVCPIDTKLEARGKHLEESTHSAFLELFRLIFEKRFGKAFCKLCKINVDWRTVKIHAKPHMLDAWHTADVGHDKYKICFENRIIKRINRYNCCICKATFANWDAVFVHITKSTHQRLKEENAKALYKFPKETVSYEFLVCEGLLASSATALECRICGGSSVGRDSVARHVNGLMHKSNQSKFVLEFNEREECTTEQRHSALEEVEAGTSAECSAVMSQISPCNYIMKRSPTDSYCVICNRTMFHHSVDNHLNEKDHLDARKENGCDEISLKNGIEYHCKVCDRTMTGPWSVYSHVMGNRHMKALIALAQERLLKKTCKVKSAEQPEVAAAVKEGSKVGENCNSLQESKIFGTFDTAKNSDEVYELASITRSPHYNYLVIKPNDSRVNCIICDCTLSASWENINAHVTGKSHTKSLNKYGCANIVSEKDTSFRCICCNLAIPGLREVHLHVKSEAHLSVLNELEKSSSKPNATVSTKGERLLNPLNTFGRQQILMNNACSLETSETPNLDSHEREGEPHSSLSGASRRMQMQKRLGSLEIPKKPKFCSSGADERRLVSLDKKSGEKHVANSQVAPGIHQRLGPIPGTIGEKSSFDCVVQLNDTDFCCKVCDCIFSATSFSMNIHLTGGYHTESLKKYGCDYICMKQGNIYYCECCKFAMGDLGDVYLHIKKDNHVNSAAESSRRRLFEVDEPSTKRIALSNQLPQAATMETPQSDIRQLLTVEQSLGEDEMPEGTESGIEIAFETSPAIYILEQTPNNLQCTICDLQLHDYSEINHHVAGAQHADAMEKHGCDCIFLKGDSVFYCACCNCDISGCINVSGHVKGRRHFFALQTLSDKQRLLTVKRNLDGLKSSEQQEVSSALSLVTKEILKMLAVMDKNEKKRQRQEAELE